MDPAPSPRIHTPEMDAINLMLRDLNTRHDEIRHRAAFRGCTGELLVLQKELVAYLNSKKQELLAGSTIQERLAGNGATSDNGNHDA
ncbi:MAG: hypothetical protein VKP63_10310 [Cyanobacteriota bacterium]|nr:hypothetical protein [Cyanobacteriota bacterium]